MNPPQRIGPYRVERLLGFGSFATVWLGHDPALDARVAIKVLAENWSHDLRVRERFLDEARLLWRLDHQRLVRVHSVGELADGRPYLVMAWAEGGSLRDRLAAGPLPVGRALWVLREIAAGVAVLHANGIVHRDLTPGNVLFQPSPANHLPDESATTPTTGSEDSASGDAGTDESVLIADLGLAKALAAASGLTARAGTPGYMAPEQESPAALVDARTDVFGLGRLGTTLLGTPPPGATGPEDTPGRNDTADGPAGAIALRPGVPPDVAAVLHRATARSPAERYPDAAAFAAALDLATGTAGPSASTDQPSPVRRPRRRPLRAATLLGAATLAVTALAGTAFTVLWPGWLGRDSRIGTDSTSRITVALPEGWRATGSGWIGQRGPDGDLEPALVMSPDPERWPTDPTVPGAFVGLSGSLAERHDPAGYLAERPHAECEAAPVRTVRRGSVDWYVAAFTACRTGKPVIVEVAALAPDSAGLLYVQVAPPANASANFVDTLLAGIRVRP
ncbi:serine/threonine-protein kinase [Plantactinospora endophytica]|uniref:non-specific serine/threonine protein kinase n=1 Tax=Plantactinospora endophytica TaxID=673535 RepID=A0ABQ4E9S7_9ACTN|nr:serine/threonine-protein kinase [Plantactinospora endophytica]GIG91482.1 serine/threonine protein kinase [Plantactinospora endophytica]